ncbi:MAG TPA: aldo/keto reductase [Candidatus Latescibacteria bacterium]|nr:aldo/keto reductase [Candidatus Latescibacterota bacterium]HQK22734.1 aldo/keto reductase [Candidatus Latescibacterota bacterium]
MELRQLGKSDLKVTPVVFGAWAIGGWFWGGTDDAEAVTAIRAAVDEGINTIDTAPMYGFGHSEEVVGKALKGIRDKVIVATKCGLRWNRTDGDFHFVAQDEQNRSHQIYKVLKPDSIIEECDLSLKRLNVDVIDLYQCHWPDTTTPIADTMGALMKLKEQGKIRAVGVSNFTPAMMRECLNAAPLASDQPKYSLLAREIEADVLPFCRENNIGVIVYSPLAQGLLTGKVTMDRQFAPGDLRVNTPWFQPQNRQRVLDALGRIRPIADAHRATLGQVAINCVINTPGVTSAIVGARNAAQVRENVHAAEFRLSEEEQSFIRSTFESLGKPV